MTNTATMDKIEV